MVYSDVANTLDKINYNNRIEDFVLISAKTAVCLSLTIISPASDCWSAAWRLYWYIGNMSYLHISPVHCSLLFTDVIFSYFLPFCFSFFSLYFFLSETLNYILHFFSANLENFLGPTVLRSAILCSIVNVLRKRKNSIDEMKIIKGNLINHQSIMHLLLIGTLIWMMILVLMFLLLD